jgi:hypothetical protein
VRWERTAETQNPASAGFFFCRYNPPAMPYDILIVTVLLALTQVAGLMLLARGVVWLLGPKARQGNVIYDLLTAGTAPFIRFARAVTPRFVRDVHLPWITFFLLFLLYVGLVYAKLALCASHGIDCKQLVQ